MCGIVYALALDNKPVANRIISQYQNQKLRGSDGYGWIIIGKTTKRFRVQYEAEAIKLLKNERASEIMFHHRLPTSTPNIPEANHPIKVETVDRVFYLVHNGVISNANLLKASHACGYETEVKKHVVYSVGEMQYLTNKDTLFNDSEALAIDIVKTLTGEQDRIRAEGSIAFILLETDKKGIPLFLHYGRNEKNPLVVEKTKKTLYIKSEGMGEDIKANTLFTFCYETGKTTERAMSFGARAISYYSEYEKMPTLGFTYDKGEKTSYELEAVDLEIEELEIEIEYTQEIEEKRQLANQLQKLRHDKKLLCESLISSQYENY